MNEVPVDQPSSLRTGSGLLKTSYECALCSPEACPKVCPHHNSHPRAGSHVDVGGHSCRDCPREWQLRPIIAAFSAQPLGIARCLMDLVVTA